MNLINFIDNFIIFLNVLEQFAIRATIFNLDVEELINYVNKFYFINNDKNFILSFISQPITDKNINPEELVQAFRNKLDNDLNNLTANKLTFCKDIIFIY